jgi:ectoine hydroxylase-related dioxygenase (phytanoyl-CoA dioxygenase family)
MSRMNPLANSFRQLRDLFFLTSGLVIYSLVGKNTSFAYQALIRLFCRTGGRSNDFLSAIISRVAPPVAFGPATGVLGNLGELKISDIVQTLKSDGYLVFPRQLPRDICERLVKYAKSTESQIRTTEEESLRGTPSEHAVYDREHPRGIRYDFSQHQVINIPDVQALLADPSVLAVAQAYLGSRPVADVTSMWWHTAYSDQPDSNAAQFYHFDMDRIRWLKIFVYLTDVSPDNGPHCFVAGSHRSGGIPPALLAKGYARLSDEEVSRNFPAERLKEFCAPAGTIIIEDTRGLHKGHAVRRGDRLMLQLQFSNSLFGGSYSPSVFSSMISELKKKVDMYPEIYRNYLKATRV